MVFGQKRKILTSDKKVPSERASQEEQNDANFSFVAPSSEEFWALKESENLIETMDYSPWFSARN